MLADICLSKDAKSVEYAVAHLTEVAPVRRVEMTAMDRPIEPAAGEPPGTPGCTSSATDGLTGYGLRPGRMDDRHREPWQGKDMDTVRQRKAGGNRKSLEVRNESAPRPKRRGARHGQQSNELVEWTLKARMMPDVRSDLVAQLRAEIEAGTYETPEKLDAAIEGLLADLGDD